MATVIEFQKPKRGWRWDLLFLVLPPLPYVLFLVLTLLPWVLLVWLLWPTR